MTQTPTVRLLQSVDFAALTDPSTGELPSTRTLTGSWWRPTRLRVALEDEWGFWLLLAPSGEQQSGRETRLKSGVLIDFLALVHGSPADVLRFARRHGVLQLCAEHRLPLGPPLSVPDPERLAVEEPAYVEHGHGVCFAAQYVDEQESGWAERTDDWIRLSTAFSAAMGIVDRLAQAKAVAAADWDALRYLEDPWVAYRFADKPRQRIAGLINGLATLAGVRYQLDWSESPRPRALLATDSLFAGLMVRLQEAAAAGSLALCSGCGLTYSPERRPSQNRDNYCAACRGKKTAAAASRRYRLKKQAERQAQDGK